MVTFSQNKTLEFIKKFIQMNGFSPTMAEIAKGIGINSRGVVHRYVSALASEGLLQIIPGKRRNIKLLEKHANLLPLVGKIAAGKPIEAILVSEPLDIVNIFLGPDRYALKVVGDSMIEEGIFDGDIVVCEYCQTAEEGKIVVALIDQEEATLKRIHFNKDGTIMLIPANSRLTPMIYAKERIQIQGIYVGLLRFGN